MTFDRRGKSPLGAFVRSPLGVFGQEEGATPPAYSYSGTVQDVAFTDSGGAVSEGHAFLCTNPLGQFPNPSGNQPAGQLWDFSRSVRFNLTRDPLGQFVPAVDKAHELSGLKFTGQLSGTILDCVAEADLVPAECSGPLSGNRGYAIYWSSVQRLDQGGTPWPLASVKGFTSMWATNVHATLFVVNENRQPWFITGETVTVEVVREWP